ncbi:MAG: alpha-xylosidase [Polyangiaceae bacterium]
MEQYERRLNQPPDPGKDFLDSDAYLFVATKLSEFDLASGTGKLVWARHRRKPRIAFNHMTMPLEAVEAWEFPGSAYPEPKTLPFSLSFVDDGTVRLRMRTRPGAFGSDAKSAMLSGPVPSSSAWQARAVEGGFLFESPLGSVKLDADPWALEVRDRAGKVLLRTHTMKDGRCMIGGRPLPFSYVRRSADVGQSVAASFTLFPGERIYGCGESFSAPNKRGQTVLVSTQDAHGTQTDEMYKPVPFYLSNRGYGVFVHGSTPMAFDFGHSYADTQVLFNGDDNLDLFVFLGTPKEVLTRYTALTGRSPLPPLWSFGLWMSRITYSSEEETRGVANKLREHRVPCDVIHLDTGWFENDWSCDYRFSPTRFKDPRRMVSDLKQQGFHLCLWQLPYFTPKNPLFAEIVERGLNVRSASGELLSEDVVLDFTNPDTVAWYQKKLSGLLELGVGAIKVDFGEGAPLNGLYHSGRSGWYEHNLYPLLYNRAAGEASQATNGYTLIWARSAWAGSQRYPLHWGGDAEASDGGMLGSLWGGLSFGLSGFSFWSHDVGGFFPATPRDLYLRWLPFGLFNSHSRCHGLPPTEPWEFDAAFLDAFRKAVELRYRLMPYIWAQAAASARRGHPMLRPLFFEFGDDPTSWLVDDAFLFGSDILVAPLFEEVNERAVYLPPGEWVDLQSGAQHRGGAWVTLSAGDVKAVISGSRWRVDSNRRSRGAHGRDRLRASRAVGGRKRRRARPVSRARGRRRRTDGDRRGSRGERARARSEQRRRAVRGEKAG